MSRQKEVSVPNPHAQRARPGAYRSFCKLLTIALVAVFWYPVTAGAGDSGVSMFSVKGFGTLGVVHSSEDRADFANSFFDYDGAGFSHSWSAAVDSKLGAQVTANFTPQLSAVLQVISEQRYDGSYTPHLEWANIKYQITPEFGVRAGRIVLPGFLYSDSRKIGYAQPWVRPPVEVYSLVPLSNSDGMDASYKLHIGAAVHTFTGSYGQIDTALPPDGTDTAHARHMWVLSDTVEYGALTAQVSVSQLRLSSPGLSKLFDGFRQFGPQGIALANKYDVHDRLVRFMGLGATYDPGSWFFTTEWGNTDFDSVFGDITAWYASGGYRFGNLMPYLTYSQVIANSVTSDPGLNLSALPPFLAGPATGLNAALNGILETVAVQKTISVGARWDFRKNVDLKLQFDHSQLGSGSSGTLINVQRNFQPGGTFNLFSLTVDFVL
jgi:hypothetical protein